MKGWAILVFSGAVFACDTTSSVEEPPSGFPPGFEDPGVWDAGPDRSCQCALDDAGVLSMSFGCYCQLFDCRAQPLYGCGDMYIESWSGCGLRTDHLSQPQNETRVFSGSTMVGGKRYITPAAKCPDNSTLEGVWVMGGRQSVSGCTSSVSCCHSPYCR